MTEDTYTGRDWFSALTKTARAIWDERADVRSHCGTIHSLTYWQWLMEEGWRESPEVRSLLPVPPRELIERVRGGVTPEEFHSSAVSEAWLIFTLLSEAGFDFGRRATVLDYGCGSGRLLRIFGRFADTLELHGADVDADAIAWCAEHIPFARCLTVNAHPPSSYPDGFFDAVYSYSVFSHLPETLQLEWLEELSRIARHGAIVLLTIQGRRCAERFSAGNACGLTFPSAEALRADLPRLEERGFLHYPYPEQVGSLPASLRKEDLQGMTFILESHVREQWSRFFEVIAFHESPQGWQDFVILRK